MTAVATILVVDDNAANIRLLEAILENEGYRVVGVDNGPEALTRVTEGDVDLVLLDINMPGMNGHEVCRRIREADPRRLLPIVMVTASANETANVALDAGADDFVARPFNQAELVARVRSLLRIKQLHDTVESQARQLAALNTSLQARVDEQLDELSRFRRLQRFLSPQVADLVLHAGDDTLLEPHRREIAVVFCDVRGFTHFTSTAEPEELLDVLREFHDSLGELVALHGATVGHFAGDGVMLFFNDPVPCPDPALRAARLAVDVRDRFAPLRDAWIRRGHDLGIGIGISFGFATLGIIGFEGRYDYSALGAVVNRASRLCGAAAAGEILVGPRAFDAITEHVVSEARPAVAAKGFSDPILARALVSVRPGGEAAGGADRRTSFHVLGPLQVVVADKPLDIGAAKERALLARLLLDAGRVVPSDILVDDLWDASPPESAAASLRVLVSRLRKCLSAAGADALIVTRPPGYVIEVDSEAIDAVRFEAMVTDARRRLDADPDHDVADTLRQAVALWRGAAYEEIAGAVHAAPAAERLEELRLTTIEDRIDAELAVGHHGVLVGELQALVKATPLRERLWGQLMVALYRSGRQADALRAFQELRTVLGDEVGLEPSPALVQLESAILNHSLDPV